MANLPSGQHPGGRARKQPRLLVVSTRLLLMVLVVLVMFWSFTASPAVGSHLVAFSWSVITGQPEHDRDRFASDRFVGDRLVSDRFAPYRLASDRFAGDFAGDRFR